MRNYQGRNLMKIFKINEHLVKINEYFHIRNSHSENSKGQYVGKIESLNLDKGR